MNKSSMFRALVLLVLMLSSFVTIKAEGIPKNPSWVLYNDTLVLTKEMFKAKPVNNSYEITTAFSFDYIIEQHSVFMNVFSFMITKESKPARECGFDKRVLRHELYHFKITEVWARIFSAKISGKGVKRKKVNKYLNKQYEAHSEACDSMQDLYDLETNHSKNKEKQKEWELKIDKMLEEYKDYANKEIVIKLK